jgi:hypothetical protein
MTTEVPCFYPDPDSYREGTEPPEEFGEWRPASGSCSHDYCIEGNWIVQLFRAQSRMTPDEIEATKADLELVADEYGGVWRDA